MNAFIPFQFDGRQVGANTRNDSGTVRGFKAVSLHSVSSTVSDLSLDEQKLIAQLRCMDGKDRSFVFRLFDTITAHVRKTRLEQARSCKLQIIRGAQQ